MVWYYADGDRQRGPISDEEFQEMVSNGRIRRETLVWKDGMENWQSLQSAHDAGHIAALSPAASSVIVDSQAPAASSQPAAHVPRELCSQCGRGPLGIYDGVKLGNLMLCRDCDSDLARHYLNKSTSSQVQSPQPNAALAPEALDYAGIPARFIAKFIDQVIAGIVMFIVVAVTVDVSLLQDALDVFKESGNAEQMYGIMRPALLIGLIFTVLYDAILVGFFGATLGKMALGIRVVSADGAPVAFSQAIVRSIAPAILQLPGIMLSSRSIVSQVSGFAGMFAYLIAIADTQKRTLFDHIAGTRVVRN